MALTNNRRGALTPKNSFDTSIGSEFRRIDTLYGSNVNLTGGVTANYFSGDGSGLKNLVFDFKATQNEEGKNSFENLEVDNLTVKGGLNATLNGDGNNLDLGAIQGSIIPGQSYLSLGAPFRKFQNIFVNEVQSDDVYATKFHGDGSELQNLNITFPDTDFSKVKMNVLPTENEAYDIGKNDKRFHTLHTKNVSANGSIMGGRLMITNTPYQITQSITNVSAPWSYNDSLPESIMEKLGSQIDISVDNIIVKFAVIGESIADTMIIRSKIIPENPSTVDLGSKTHPFGTSYITYMSIENFICQQQAQFNQDINVNQTLTASNFVGDGRNLKNVEHLGPITTPISPIFNNIINLGEPNKAFKDLHVMNGFFKNINIEGEMRNNNKNLASYVSGFCVPKEGTYKKAEPLLYSSESVSQFLTVYKEQGKFIVKKSGLYNIGFYAWSTNRNKKDDVDVLWKIEHYSPYSEQTHSYNMGSLDISKKSTSIILRQGDIVTIIVEPGKSRSESNPLPLTIFEKGALVWTLNTVFDTFI